jgi:hypothetical protein
MCLQLITIAADNHHLAMYAQHGTQQKACAGSITNSTPILMKWRRQPSHQHFSTHSNAHRKIQKPCTHCDVHHSAHTLFTRYALLRQDTILHGRCMPDQCSTHGNTLQAPPLLLLANNQLGAVQMATAIPMLTCDTVPAIHHQLHPTPLLLQTLAVSPLRPLQHHMLTTAQPLTGSRQA